MLCPDARESTWSVRSVLIVRTFTPSVLTSIRECNLVFTFLAQFVKLVFVPSSGEAPLISILFPHKSFGGPLHGPLVCAVKQAHGGIHHVRREHHPFPLSGSFWGTDGVRNGRRRKAVEGSGSWRTLRTGPHRRQGCDFKHWADWDRG